MRFRPCLFALTLCWPAIAGAGDWEISLGTGNAHHLRHAGTALYTNFFGEPPDEGSGGAHGLGGLTSQPGAVAVQGAWQIGLAGGGVVNEAASGARLRYRAGLSLGTARIDLPGGLGIFTDPAVAEVRALSLSAGLIADTAPLPLGQAELRLSSEFGAVATAYDASLTSALLDIRATSSMAAPYVGVGLDLARPARPGGPAVALRAGGRLYGNRHSQATLELVAGF